MCVTLIEFTIACDRFQCLEFRFRQRSLHPTNTCERHTKTNGSKQKKIHSSIDHCFVGVYTTQMKEQIFKLIVDMINVHVWYTARFCLIMRAIYSKPLKCASSYFTTDRPIRCETHLKSSKYGIIVCVTCVDARMVGCISTHRSSPNLAGIEEGRLQYAVCVYVLLLPRVSCWIPQSTIH